MQVRDDIASFMGIWSTIRYSSPEDKEKTTLTCPYATFAFKCMQIGLCNSPSTFKRCMMSIFSDMVEDNIEGLIDDLFVVEDSFHNCLDH